MRVIDADALHAEISAWPESIMYKDWVQSAIASAPTLTQPNEPLTLMEKNEELIRTAKKAADAWRNDSAYWQAGQIIDMLLEELDKAALTQPPVTGDTSDGYHTFNELYHHRAVLFSVICNEHHDIAWKSKRHHDGTMYDGMFIVGIDTPEGQATYHYDIDPYWNLFRVKELELAPEWDGHTPGEAIRRIGTLTQPNEWVSVYDRLPEPGERVLATDCGFVGEFYINKRGKWQRYNVNCSELLMALDILYWMPLPAPPDRRPPEGDGGDVGRG